MYVCMYVWACVRACVCVLVVGKRKVKSNVDTDGRILLKWILKKQNVLELMSR
jgi:hypothetical protein